MDLSAGNLFGMYVRLRHSAGFGIHSPLAYRLVREVVSAVPRGYDYYDSVASGSRDAGQLHRLIARFGPVCHLVAGRKDGLYERVLSHFPSLPEAPCPLPEGPVLLYGCGDESVPALLELCGRPDTLIYARHISAGGCALLSEAVKCGAVLQGRHKLIAVTDPQVSRVVYRCLL